MKNYPTERDPDRVYIEDTRRFNFCVDGLRYILESHGHSLRELIQTGIPVEKLEPVDDDNVQKVLRYVRGGRKD